MIYASPHSQCLSVCLAVCLGNAGMGWREEEEEEKKRKEERRKREDYGRRIVTMRNIYLCNIHERIWVIYVYSLWFKYVTHTHTQNTTKTSQIPPTPTHRTTNPGHPSHKPTQYYYHYPITFTLKNSPLSHPKPHYHNHTPGKPQVYLSILNQDIQNSHTDIIITCVFKSIRCHSTTTL